MNKHFWEEKKLENFTTEEWEEICMNCGKCCLLKLQDEDTDDIYFTKAVCKYYDQEKCRCTEYKNRRTLVPECLKLTPQNLKDIPWMPKTCAYRYLFEERGLPLWHPLICGSLDDKHSIKNICISESKINEEDLEDCIIEWDEL